MREPDSFSYDRDRMSQPTEKPSPHGPVLSDLPPVEAPSAGFIVQLFVIPAGTPFRGFRWPREGEPCLFLAIAPAGATFTRL